jgi:hypothetical protein
MKKLLDKPMGMVGLGTAIGIFFLIVTFILGLSIGYTSDESVEGETLWLEILLALAIILNFVAFFVLFLYFGYISAKRHGLGITDAGFRVATVYAGVTVALLIVHVVLLYEVGMAGATLLIEDQATSDEFALETGRTIGEQVCDFTISLLVGTPINFGVGALGALLAGKQKNKEEPSVSKPTKKP